MKVESEMMMDLEMNSAVDDISCGEHAIFSASSSQDYPADEESREGLSDIPVEVVMTKHKIQASTEQKELMMGFIQENPEMITHSSTPENEKDLWEDLTNQLNVLKPEKTQENWKNVWYRWSVSVFKKSEEKLKSLDIKLRRFLKQLKSDSSGKLAGRMKRPKKHMTVEEIDGVKQLSSDSSGKMVTSDRKSKKRMTLEEMDKVLNNIENERLSLHLEIDESEINILKFKSMIEHLKRDNISRTKRLKKLNERKIYLNNKRRKIHERETTTIDILEKKLLDIKKRLAEDES